MFKGAIFDVDGTILDSMGVWDQMTKRFLNKHGIEYDETLIDRFRCMTLRQSLETLTNLYALNMTCAEVTDEFNSMALEEYALRVPAKTGAVEYIRRLAENGVKIAIATSGFRAPCQSAFERIGIEQYISAYAFSDEVGVDKSNPDVYLLAAERIGVSPCECMVFEDILHGINGAKRAGMRTTAIYDDSNRAETEQLKATAERYITDWRKLDDFTV